MKLIAFIINERGISRSSQQFFVDVSSVIYIYIYIYIIQGQGYIVYIVQGRWTDRIQQHSCKTIADKARKNLIKIFDSRGLKITVHDVKPQNRQLPRHHFQLIQWKIPTLPQTKRRDSVLLCTSTTIPTTRLPS